MQWFLFGTFIFPPVSFEKIFGSALITQIPAPAIKLPLIVTWAVPLIQLSAMLYCKLISIEKKICTNAVFQYVFLKITKNGFL
jgi:hypothetical protein